MAVTMFGSLGGSEILLILLVLVLLFGAKKLPELAKGMGQAIKEFKHGVQDSSEDEPSGKSAGGAEKKES